MPAARSRSRGLPPVALELLPLEVPRPAGPARRARGWRGPALGLGLAALASLALLWSGPPERVRALEPAELARISPHLASGYRATEGGRPAFFGTLRPEWLEQPPPAQRRAVRAIGEALAERGVRRALLFDARHRLRARWSRGRVELPGAAPVSARHAAGGGRAERP